MAKSAEKVAPIDKAPAAKSGFSFTKKRSVTLELLKPKVNEEFYVKFASPIYQAKETRSAEQIEKDGGQNAPPMLANVTNLETGEECVIIIPSVLQSELTDNYENDTYNGLCFALTKLGKQDGKRYHGFVIIEIEVD